MLSQEKKLAPKVIINMLLCLVGFATAALALESHQQAVGFDSLVILGVGSSGSGPWTTELTLSNPSAITTSLVIDIRPGNPPLDPNFAAALVPPNGCTRVDGQAGIAANRQLTTLYVTPVEGFPLPTARARVYALFVPSPSIDMPVFRLSTLIGLNPDVLSFPGAVQTPSGAHSNLILANLRQLRRFGEPDPGQSVSLLVEVYAPDGQLLGSKTVTLDYGQTVFIVGVLGALGVQSATLCSPFAPHGPEPGCTVRVSRAAGTGFFWGVMPSVLPDGSYTVSLGTNP